MVDFGFGHGTLTRGIPSPILEGTYPWDTSPYLLISARASTNQPTRTLSPVRAKSRVQVNAQLQQIKTLGIYRLGLNVPTTER